MVYFIAYFPTYGFALAWAEQLGGCPRDWAAKANPRDLTPLPSQSWRRWYRDTFDRDSGTSLELEDRTLDLGGPRERLNQWVFEGRSVANGYLQAADHELITCPGPCRAGWG